MNTAEKKKTHKKDYVNLKPSLVHFNILWYHIVFDVCVYTGVI